MLIYSFHFESKLTSNVDIMNSDLDFGFEVPKHSDVSIPLNKLIFS